jgi:hypothetical protein
MEHLLPHYADIEWCPSNPGWTKNQTLQAADPAIG